MTADESSSKIAQRTRIAVLVGAPLLLAAVFALASAATRKADPAETRLQDVQQAFADLMDEASVLAESAASAPDLRAVFPVAGGRGMAARLEGFGRISPDKTRFREWAGTPAEPTEHFTVDISPAWRIRREGAQTQLIVRAGPDEQARHVLASFRVDSLEELLPSRMSDGYGLEIRFEDYERGHPDSDRWRARRAALAGDETRLEAPLLSPEGLVLGSVHLSPLDPARRSAGLRRTGVRLAVTLFVFLATVLFDWRVALAHGRGALVAGAAIIGLRHLLVLADASDVLLPRAFGEASLYGSTSFFGWFRSPGDLLLSAGAFYLLTAVVRRYARAVAVRSTATAGALATALGLGAATIAVSLSRTLSRDARIDLMDLPAADPQQGVRLVLIAGWVLALVGAGCLLGEGLRLLRGKRSNHPFHSTVVVVFVLLCGAGSELLYAQQQSLRVERLRSEFAPQIQQQDSQRELALRETVRGVTAAYSDPTPLLDDEGLPARSAYLAYELWVESELFNGGYQSALELYGADGEPISRFGFDLPPLEGQIIAPPEELIVYRETPAGRSRGLLVAEAPLAGNGVGSGGHVVARIVDEPDNVPFLPRNQTYLAALAGRPPLPAGGEVLGGLELVLFEHDGKVGLSTLDQPPAYSDRLLDAAEQDQTVRISSGDRRYVGIAVRDDERLQLLLVTAANLLSRLAAIVRLALVGLAWMIVVGAAAALMRRQGLLTGWRQVRSSFYRKLLAALLVASIVPLVGLSLFLSGYVKQRAQASLVRTATQYAQTAQRIVEDYGSAQTDAGIRLEESLNDQVLQWLADVVGQELHIYIEGRIAASSQAELFASGVLPRRLHSDVDRALFDRGRSYLVAPLSLGTTTIPVAYARVRDPSMDTPEDIVVAVPLLRGALELQRDVSRIREMILLATVLLVFALGVTAAMLARTVARPVRALVSATSRIAGGDYATRLRPQTRDEVAELVEGFNRMASSLSEQRDDLERRREYTERLVSNATTGVLSTDASGRIVKINPAARRLLGETGKLTEGAPLIETLATDATWAPLAEALSRSYDNPEPREIDLDGGDDRPLRYRFVRIELEIPGSTQVGSLILVDDVTDLMRSNQLEAWAEMARAIAHEIKNPLTPIQLSTDHLRRILEDRGVMPDPAIDACLNAVQRQVRSLHEIAGEFSTYARLPDLKLESCDPAQLLRETLSPYRHSPPDGIRVEEDYRAAPNIAADPRALSRALINLVQNAIQAMPDGGTLRASVVPGPNGDVVLAISDTGTGIDPETRRRLFEPYFSTKSSGTGLGLAIVKRTIEAHHGRLACETAPGAGSTFTIRIPSASLVDSPSE